MANDISSMMTGKILVPGLAKNTGQFAKPEAANQPEIAEQSLSETGKDLPLRQQPAEAVAEKAEELREAVNRIENIVQSVKRNLSFSLDESSGRTVIRVIDSKSGELVRQIPSEEVLALSAHLSGLSEDSVVSGDVPIGILFSDTT